jgi:hypothetical protein
VYLLRFDSGDGNVQTKKVVKQQKNAIAKAAPSVERAAFFFEIRI